MIPPLVLLGGAAALAAVWLSGAALSSAVGLREGRLRDLTLDMVLGTLLLGFGGSLVLVAGARIGVAAAAALLAAPVVLALATRRLRLRVRGPWPTNPRALGLLVAAALVLAVVVTAALRDRLGWDGFAFWTLKATMLFQDGALPADLYDANGPYDYAHADYPPGLPLAVWWTYRVAGTAHPGLASFAGALWLVLLVVLVWDSARPYARPELAALAALAVAAFWPLARTAPGGEADLLVAIALLGVSAHLADTGVSGDAALWRAGLFGAFGALIKNEGLALAVMLAIVGVAWLARTRRLSAARAAPLVLPFLLAMPWKLWVRAQGLEAEHLGPGVELADLPGRAVVLIRELAGMALYRSWAPVPFIAAAAIVLALRPRPPLRLRLPLAVLGLYFLTLVGVYVLAPLDVAWLVETSASRVLGALAPATAFFAVVAAGRQTEGAVA